MCALIPSKPQKIMFPNSVNAMAFIPDRALYYRLVANLYSFCLLFNGVLEIYESNFRPITLHHSCSYYVIFLNF